MIRDDGKPGAAFRRSQSPDLVSRFGLEESGKDATSLCPKNVKLRVFAAPGKIFVLFRRDLSSPITGAHPYAFVQAAFLLTPDSSRLNLPKPGSELDRQLPRLQAFTLVTCIFTKMRFGGIIVVFWSAGFSASEVGK
jgi:hypothetical protein